MKIYNTHYNTYDRGEDIWFTDGVIRPWLTSEERIVLVADDGCILYNTTEGSYSYCVWVAEDEIDDWIEIDSQKGNLTFKAEADSTVTLTKTGNPFDISVKYSFNGIEWTDYEIDTEITLNEGQYIFFRNEFMSLSQSESDYYQFVTTGSLTVSGNISSMIGDSEYTKPYCFASLFKNNTAVTSIPVIGYDFPSEGAYASMFEGCTAITKADIGGLFLEERTMRRMFYGCSSLSDITVHFEDWNEDGLSTEDWVKNVAQSGTFTAPDILEIIYDDSHIPAAWGGEKNWFFVRNWNALASVDIAIVAVGNPDPAYFEFRLGDDDEWHTYTIGTSVNVPYHDYSDSGADTLYLRGINSRIGKTNSDFYRLTVTGGTNANIRIGGDIMTLKGDGNPLVDHDFKSIFSSLTALRQADDLILSPDTLEPYCYNGMFAGCTALTVGPETPAMTLADYCYGNMYYNCSSLTVAEALPAVTLAEGCYQGMHYGNTALQTAAVMSAVTLDKYCCDAMYQGCTSLTDPGVLLSETTAQGCYGAMFEGCTSLETAPLLRAVVLTAACYAEMFYGCTALNRIEVRFTDWTVANATRQWLDGVSATGTFLKTEDLAEEYGTGRIPTGWTVQDSNA